MSLRIILFSLLLLRSLMACSITPPAGELIEGHLRPCPNRPNCVSSDISTFNPIAPLSFTSSSEEAWQEIQIIIKELGGEIVETRPMYLWATFTSKFFHFTDDTELRLDREVKHIHIRSGARIGYSDFGVNSQRVEKIRQIFSKRSQKNTRQTTIQSDGNRSFYIKKFHCSKNILL